MLDSLWGRVCQCGTCGGKPMFSKRDATPEGVIFECALFRIACENCRVVTENAELTLAVEEWNDKQVEAARGQA